MSKISEAKERQADRKHVAYFNSRFAHLNIHNGFRPCELHTFIAEKGGGKSTLVRAWVVEMLAQQKKVYIRLSEEYTQSYRDDILSFFTDQHEQLTENLFIDSELELTQKELGANYVTALRARIVRSGAQILILDNFTTSDLSRNSPTTQERLAVDLRRLAYDADIPVIVVAHTEKGFNKSRGIATGDNIRGNMTLSNTAGYIYTLTVFHNVTGKPSVLFIDKARHHSEANKRVFLLTYDPQLSTYTKDVPAMFEDIKAIMKEAQK